MIVTEQQYRAWQQRLLLKKVFYWFWLWWGIYSVLIFLGIAAYLAPTPVGRKVVVFGVLVLLFTRYVICEGIYAFYSRKRPYQAYEFSQPTSWLFSRTKKRFDSFPSAHAASAAALATLIFFYYPGLGVFGFISAIFTSVGRVVLGYHYVSDIVVGFAIGMAISYLAYFFLNPYLFTVG